MLVYPGDPSFHSHSVSSFKQGDICEVSEFTMGSHCGTHLDAPLHMIPDGVSIDHISLDHFIGPCRVITEASAIISEKALMEHDIQEGDRILLRTDPKGKHVRHRHFNPSVISMRAAQYLAQKKVMLVGIDAPTIENMELCDGEVHRALLGAGIPILEGLLLENAPDGRYMLYALPLAIKGGNGAPCRAVLIAENE